MFPYKCDMISDNLGVIILYIFTCTELIFYKITIFLRLSPYVSFVFDDLFGDLDGLRPDGFRS